MEDLQTLWHKAQRQEDAQVLPAVEIDKIVHQKSLSVFTTFKRTVFWELLFNILFTLSCVYYGWVSELRKFPVIVGACLLLLVGFVTWQLFFYLRLRRHPYDHNVHHYLRSSLALLKEYVLHYKIVYGALLPIAAVLGFALESAAEKAGTELPLLVLPENPWLAGIMVMATSALVIGALYFLLKFLYQAKIDRMQTLVNNLEQRQ